MNGNPDSTPARTVSFRDEFLESWNKLPNKGMFFALLTVWLLLFQFLGNCSFGYIATPSLLHWMLNAYWTRDYHSTVPETGWASHVWNLFLGYWDGGMSDDGHGLLMPVVVLVLLWWKKDQLLALQLKPWPQALVLLAIALALHLVGYLVQQQRVSIVALFVGIYALTGIVWGPGWLRRTFFPFVLFAFCVPIAALSQPITFPMRILVCKIVVVISSVIGVDVVRNGTALLSPTGNFQYEVAAACSGLRSVIAIFCISTIYGFVAFQKGWKRALIMLCAFPLAIAGNVVRMMFIVVAAEFGGQSTGDFVHENWFFSLLPYVPAIIGVMLLGHWLREREAQPKVALEGKPV